MEATFNHTKMRGCVKSMKQTILNIIMYSGEARSLAVEAIQSAKKGDFDKAKELLDEADEQIASGLVEQLYFIQKEASGEMLDFSFLLVHAQDHLMNAITFKELAEEFVEVYKRK